MSDELSPLRKFKPSVGKGRKGRGSILDRVDAFESLSPKLSAGASPALTKPKLDLEIAQVLEDRRGSVMGIKLKIDDQVRDNEESRKRRAQEKEDRKAIYRKTKKKKKDARDTFKRVISKEIARTNVCWNEVKAESLTVDPKTYKAPTNLLNPTPLQEELIEKAMKQSLLLQHFELKTNTQLLHAFEEVEVEKGTELSSSDDGNYFYVVEHGKVDFEVNGKIVGSAQAGETFGELDLLYDENDKISTIVANAEDTKLIRLDQKAFRGIVQSQTKQEEEEKRALLQKVPFLKDLLWHKNGIEINKDTTNRLCMFMKPQVFLKGDTIVEEGDEAAAGTLYMVHAGTIELTSLNKDKFVLGPDAYVGKKAIMGVAGKGEPTVSSIAGHRDGKVYSIDKTDVNEVLGKNYFSREASRRQDSKKLGGFECVKKVELDPKSMTAMAEQIVDKPFDAGVQVLKQGDEVEPCLFFVREGAVILSTNDGKLNQRIAAGGYFGVEQLLAPKGSEKSDLEAVLIPAQWTVTVEGNEPCLCGVLPLSKVQSHLDNQFDDDSGEKPDNQFDDDSGEKPKLEQPIEASKPDYEMIKKLSLEAEVTKLLLPDISEDDDVAKLPKKPEPKKTKKSQPKKRKKLEKKKKEDVTNMIMKKRQARRTAVESTLEFHDLEMLSVLGDGQFGEVWLVEATIDGEKEQFALKRQSKTEDNVKEIQRELTVTQHLTTSHPFIVDLVHIFDTQQSVDMLMGLITGGELWDVVHREEADGNWISGIPESQAKFYALVVADTLNYMHAKKYVYRDLKPENVMIDGDGYPIIVDFGFTKVCEDMTFTFCGTPNYVSPEIIRNTGHNAGADHWALGVLIYEMIAGEHPFFFDGMDNMQVFEAICKERHYPLSKVKEGVSGAAVDLVDGLLTKETSRRLGMLAGKANDILNHKWFNGLDLIKLRSKKVKAPWVPRR